MYQIVSLARSRLVPRLFRKRIKRLLATHARSHGPATGHGCLAEVAASTVHGILNHQPVKPHKVRYYLERRDPAFDERKAEALQVCAAAEMLRRLPQAERPVAVVSYDEKPGIQAIATTAPDLPPRRPARFAFVLWPLPLIARQNAVVEKVGRSLAYYRHNIV
jgi:hypothetical protein